MTQPQPNPDELVEMQHPDLPAAPPARTTRGAFDALWAAKGFELVGVVSAAALPFTPGEEPWVATGARLEQEAPPTTSARPLPPSTARRPKP